MLNSICNQELSSYTTFGLHARAANFVILHNHHNDLDELIHLPDFIWQDALWLGGGSNILFLSDYPAYVVHMANRGIAFVEAQGEQVLIEAQAGEVWHDFVQYTLSMGWYGLENLSLIPGTVGASPVQNIGAYGVEVKDFIHSVYCFDFATERYFTLNNTECQFAYRDSIFKRRPQWLILSVIFRLSTQFRPRLQYHDLTQRVLMQDITAQDVANIVCQIRREKLPDPNVLGNVGSFYKNPIISIQQAQDLLADYPSMPYYPQENGRVKLPAGWLIDQCGLKGYTLGGAAVHDKQALVLGNKHQASAEDICALSRHICQSVKQKFAIDLQPEPLCLPSLS